MNHYEIGDSLARYARHPVLGPATYTLYALVEAVDDNSDGWAYWPKPARAAQRLMELIGTTRDYLDDRERSDATVDRLTQAYTPLRAFKTRSGLQFRIYDPADWR